MPSSKSFPVAPETTLNVVFSGPASGPAVVFLHYWGGSSRTWHKVTTILSSSLHTIAVDLRGWGDSIGPQREDAYSIQLFADDVHALLTQLGLSKYFLVGHSMGGKIAQLVASKQPKGLQGLILLPEEMKAGQLHAYDNAQSIEWTAKNILSSSPLTDDDIKLVIEDSLKGNKFAISAWPSYAQKEDISSQIDNNIKVPVLVIGAQLDKVETVEKVKEEVVSRIDNVKFIVLEKSGHLVPLEASEELAEAVKVFVNRNL